MWPSSQHKLLKFWLVHWKGVLGDVFQLSREGGGIRKEFAKVEQRGRSRVVGSMSCGSLNNKHSVLLFWLQEQGTLKLRDAEHTFSSSTVTGGDFVIDFFDELESLRVPAHWSDPTDVALRSPLSRTLQKSAGR